MTVDSSRATGPRTTRERAAVAVALFDSEHGGDLAALSRFLLQTEAVLSSKIEYVDATTEYFARAVAGGKANTAAEATTAPATRFMCRRLPTR